MKTCFAKLRIDSNEFFKEFKTQGDFVPLRRPSQLKGPDEARGRAETFLSFFINFLKFNVMKTPKKRKSLQEYVNEAFNDENQEKRSLGRLSRLVSESLQSEQLNENSPSGFRHRKSRLSRKDNSKFFLVNTMFKLMKLVK